MVALHSSFPLSSSVDRSPRRHARSEPRARRVAVVLNANARLVGADTLRWVRGVVPERDLFLSRALEQSPAIARHVLTSGYDAVLWGGGDGTFANGVAEMVAASRATGLRLPEMGVVRLGTGNAIADAIGASPASPAGLTEELGRARASRSPRELSMLEVEGRPALFCGFGLDAQILDDFGATVRTLDRLGLADRVTSAGVRYFLAVAGRSVPRFLVSDRAEVVAINRGAPALKVDVDGNPVGAPIAAGRVLWRGVATLASASTIPFYGLGMRMFPHADRSPGRFQLRLADAGAVHILSQLPKVWTGRISSPRVHDFLVDEVELVLARPSPFQANGDLLGERGGATLRLWPRPIPIV
jgi:diacylglycerol kinase family enzyme